MLLHQNPKVEKFMAFWSEAFFQDPRPPGQKPSSRIPKFKLYLITCCVMLLLSSFFQVSKPCTVVLHCLCLHNSPLSIQFHIEMSALLCCTFSCKIASISTTCLFHHTTCLLVKICYPSVRVVLVQTHHKF